MVIRECFYIIIRISCKRQRFDLFNVCCPIFIKPKHFLRSDIIGWRMQIHDKAARI